MLPQKHFDKIEKGAIDQINPSAKPTIKNENTPKKVVEIKENALDKNTKAADDDDAEYDYYYDDDNDNDEDIVTVTPKTVSNKLGTCINIYSKKIAFKLAFTFASSFHSISKIVSYLISHSLFV